MNQCVDFAILRAVYTILKETQNAFRKCMKKDALLYESIEYSVLSIFFCFIDQGSHKILSSKVYITIFIYLFSGWNT